METISALSRIADLLTGSDGLGSMLAVDHAVFARTHRRLTADERAAMAEAYRQGATLMALASRFEVSRTTVIKVLDDSGVTRRYRSFESEALVDAQRLYESGWSFARIGARHGVDPKTVYNAFKRAGIPTRPRAGR